MTEAEKKRVGRVRMLVMLGASNKEISEQMGWKQASLRAFMCKHKIKANRNMHMENNPNWKGGIGRITEGGYIKVMLSTHPYADARGMIFEHRLVMEKKIGRYLTAEEVVHHKDHIPNNNHEDNLQLFPSQAAHVWFENNLDTHPNSPRMKAIAKAEAELKELAIPF